jgi:Xaa-Pro aminopeptidase
VNAPTPEHLADARRRVDALRAIMAEQNVDAVLGIGHGAPGLSGFLRYFTNVELWAGRGFFIVTKNEADPLVVLLSNYGSTWARQLSTTPRVVSTFQDGRAPIDRVLEELRRVTKAGSRVGTLGRQTILTLTEDAQITTGLPGVEFVALDTAVNDVRQIKSKFEIKAEEETGRILAGALERFGEVARPGMPAWEAAAEAERYSKARGCFWGRSKYSIDQKPYTVPTLLNRELRRDDVILFELVYAGPLGYWYEITCLYSFGALPEAAEKRFETSWKAVQAAAAAIKPGARYGVVPEVADAVMRGAGYTIVAHHTPNCHTIGTDECDGITPPPPDDLLKENMVLSFHPSAMLEGELAYLLSDNYQITPGGGRVLSTLGKPYRRLKP